MPWRHMGEWRYSSTFLDLSTIWKWVLRFTPLQLYLQYPLNRRLDGPQSRSGRCGKETNLALPGIEPGPSSPSLYRLSYPGSCSIHRPIQLNPKTKTKFCNSYLWIVSLFVETVGDRRWMSLWTTQYNCCSKRYLIFQENNTKKFDMSCWIFHDQETYYLHHILIPDTQNFSITAFSSTDKWTATYTTNMNASHNSCYFNRRVFIFSNFPFCVDDMEFLHIIPVETLLSLSVKSNHEKLFLQWFGFMNNINMELTLNIKTILDYVSVYTIHGMDTPYVSFLNTYLLHYMTLKYNIPQYSIFCFILYRHYSSRYSRYSDVLFFIA
jgi:hypothetical protein